MREPYNKMKQLLTLASTAPRAPERALGAAIVGVTVMMLGVCASVLLWGFTLLR